MSVQGEAPLCGAAVGIPLIVYLPKKPSERLRQNKTVDADC